MKPGKITKWIGLLHLQVCLVGGLWCQMQFSEYTREAGIDHHYLSVNEIGGGAAFFDMDNDGDQDLWISGGLNWDKLYENDGTGHFKDISWEAGVPVTKNYVTTGVITGDLNNDGFKDVLLLTHTGFPNVLLRNNGNKTFSNITQSSGLGGSLCGLQCLRSPGRCQRRWIPGYLCRSLHRAAGAALQCYPRHRAWFSAPMSFQQTLSQQRQPHLYRSYQLLQCR